MASMRFGSGKFDQGVGCNKHSLLFNLPLPGCNDTFNEYPPVFPVYIKRIIVTPAVYPCLLRLVVFGKP